MRSKIYISILSLMAASASFMTSCTFEDEDYFDESAALRTEHFNEKVVNTLTNSENGWVMQFFTGTAEHHFKGYNLFAKFYDNERVLFAGNHEYLRNGKANTYTESESLYTMLGENGPVIAFNTWNDVLTVFSDPVNPFLAPNNIVKDGVGMAGDHDFSVESCEDDMVKLVGVRHQAHVRLVKCDRPWTEYIDAVNKAKADITNSSINSYYVTNATDTMYFVGLRNGVFRYCERVTDPLKMDSLACCFTPNGFFIETENKVGDTPFQEFVMAEDGTKLVSLDGKVQCIAQWDKYVVEHTARWAFDSEQFNEAFANAYQAIDVALKDYNSVYSIANLAIGRSTGGAAVTGLVVTFYTNAAKSRTNTCGIALDMTLAGFGKITYAMAEEPAKDQNLTNMMKKAPNLETAIKGFAALLNGTYVMTPDNYFLPTGATYTAVDGDLTFTLK